MNIDYNTSEKVQQRIFQVNKDIAYLLELVNDHQRYGELITVLDPTLDRLNACIVELQNTQTEELNRKIKEFEIAITKSEPPEFLSQADVAKWSKLAASSASKQQLLDFKQSLVDSFKKELFEKLRVKELTDQNTTIKQILAKIRRILLI